MKSSDELRPQAARLAKLLADASGADILGELNKVAMLTSPYRDRSPWPDPMNDPAAVRVGAWFAEPSAAGVALRRTAPAPAFPEWNESAYVSPAGSAGRVLLIGESTARGWPLASSYSPAEVLQRNLECAGPGAYQTVDLAKTGASAEDLVVVLDQAAAALPEVVVAFAGNNWSLPPEKAELSAPLDGGDSPGDQLADELARGGYGVMRARFLSLIVQRRARSFCAALQALQARTGARVVVVIPEFNLRGWQPPTDAAVPGLPGRGLAGWHALRTRAALACSAGRLDEATDLVEQMRVLDQGTSPVPGHLLGRLAESLGEGALARRELEQSRDAACGVFLRHTPRVTRGIQQFLAGFAAAQGFACVDLRRELADRDLPDLPAERYFHDYCHLSEAGVERAMAAVSDAVSGARAGTTTSGPPAPAEARAFTHAHAAAHLALQGQPPEVVIRQLRAALDADPGLTDLMANVRDLLAEPRPAWIGPAAASLAELEPLRPFLIPTAMSKALSAQLWVLRECLEVVTGSRAGGDSPVDITSPSRPVDLLAAPETGGHVGVTWRPGTSYLRASTQQSPLAFSLPCPQAIAVTLTYRTPDGYPDQPAVVSCNGTSMVRLPSRRTWERVTVDVPLDVTRSGVNWLNVTWPVPNPTPDLLAADVAALRRGEYPAVAPIFGEIFEALLSSDHVVPEGGRADLS